MKEFLKKIQCLNGFTLKLTAMVLMFIDHMGFILFPGKTWLRVIGRLSFPIFAFFVAEGFYHTKSKKKYILRMLIFALITEPVFDIAFYVKINPVHQNVLFTFLMALFGLMVLDFITKKIPDAMASKLLGGLSFAIFALFAEVMRTDYGCFGVMLVYIFYTLRENFWSKHIFSCGLQLIWGVGIQKYSALSTVLLMMYNGRQGPKMKYLFYLFYPLHLVVLYLVAELI